METIINAEDPIYQNIFVPKRDGDKLYIPPRGVQGASLMLVLSHPTHEDLQAGRILSGSYEQEVKAALEYAGFDEKDVYITSVVKVGIGNQSKPPKDLIARYAPILDYEIEYVKPKLIMSLGAEVYKRLTKSNKKQGDVLFEIIDCPYGKLLPNYSPGMILNQDPKQRPKFKDAFQYAYKFINDELSYTPYEYIIVDDVETNKYIIEHYINNGCFDVGYDAEWKGKKFTDDEVMYTFQYSCEPHKAIILNISNDGKTENRELLDTMKPLLEHDKVRRMGWNIRADDKRLTFRGFNLKEETLAFDGMKAVAFFDSRLEKGLETGVKKFTKYKPYWVPFNTAMEKHKIAKSDMSMMKFIEPDLFYDYCGGDAVAHRTACLNMMKAMEKLPPVQRNYYYDTYLPLSAYLLDLELSGIPIDQEVMKDITDKYTSKYTELLNKLLVFTKKVGFNSEARTQYIEGYLQESTKSKKDALEEAEKAADNLNLFEDFNPNSPPQKKILLYKILALDPPYYTKSGKAAKPRSWYQKARPQIQAQYSPSTNGKSLSTLKFELSEQLERNPANKEQLEESLNIVSLLLDLARVNVFANKFLSVKNTEFEVRDEEEEDEELDGLKASYWAALSTDGKIHPDFFECLNNFRSSSKPNVQNPASKVLSHIPNIFVPGYAKLSKDEQKKVEHLIPRNIRHIFYPGHKDWVWSEVDVAGADLMIAAYLSQDKDYINDMLLGNFHLKKAREYFQDPNITKDDYSKYVSAKSITFRVAYTSELAHAALPIQAEIFAESGIYIPLERIQYALNTWNSYEDYIAFRERCKNQVKEKNYIENLRGVRYYFEENENFGILSGWLNESLAYPIASELAMFLWDVSVSIKRQLVKDKVWMKYIYPVNSVHDASYWVNHKDLMKDEYLPELCKYYFTKACTIATGDRLGMEMVVADRWKGKEKFFAKETKWNFDTKEWEWKD